MPAPDLPALEGDGVSVVMTVYNEAANIGRILDSLLTGTRTPDEIVVADGGSTDGTVEIAQMRTSDGSVEVLTDVGDRASGRNSGIRAAKFERIVVIDGGCQPRANWLEKMAEAFDAGATWVGGFYEPVGPTPMSTAIGLTMVYVREEAERHFVPSARSLGFTKGLWSEVGGFPEGLQFAEDTLFAEELFKAGHRPVFAPDAIVEWEPPRNLAAQARTMFNWGRGDGSQGLRSRHYLRVVVAAGFILLGGIVLAVIDWRLTPLALLSLVPFLARNTGDKYRHMDSPMKWVLIPIAAINGTVSSTLGFIAGWLERRSTSE